MPSPVDIIFLILLGPWLMLPAVLSNMAPVFLKGKIPLDQGKEWGGKRILGDGKTIEGTVGGTLVGTVVGLGQMMFIWALGATGSQWSFGNDYLAILVIVLFAFGALFGDLLGSFIKRRLDFKGGAKFPIMDQYDLIIGVALMIILFSLIFQSTWALDRFILDWHWITLVAIIAGTFLVHRISNIIGYKIGVKDVPW